MNLLQLLFNWLKNSRNPQAGPTAQEGAGGAGSALAATKRCERHGKFYLHGAEITAGARVLTCHDGEWQERLNPFITVGP